MNVGSPWTELIGALAGPSGSPGDESSAAAAREPVTARTLRSAIADVLEKISAYELADECVKLGLDASAGDADDPWRSKWKYVERRLRHKDLPELVALAHQVDSIFDSPALRDIIGRVGLGGVAGELKNIIFASNGPKPDIVFSDAINNDIEVVRHQESFLIYDRPIGDRALTWRQLISWWARQDHLDEVAEAECGRDLYRRLGQSMVDNGAERFVMHTYAGLYARCGFDIPALLPQVYLHYDPLGRRRDGRRPALTRQRMDFLVLLPHHRRIVIEVDGKQHYADGAGLADPRAYAEMVAADRKLQLAGYEVYRIGGHELVDRRNAEQMLNELFVALLEVASV
jgi:very-short-patch-repair endonuclease